LLPRRLSQAGPGVCWFDLDGDSWDDLIVGGGRGGTLAVFRNDRQGGFARLSGPPWNQTLARDQTAIVGMVEPDGTRGLLVGAANYEDGQATGGAVGWWVPGQTNVLDVVPASASTPGPLALGDLDGDGALDLFVGGRSVPGRYPEPAQSQIWRRQGAGWELDTANTARLTAAGLVCGAVWTDLNGDGWPELALACEWGPLRIFRNDRGTLTEWHPPLTWAGGATKPVPVSSLTPLPSSLSALTGWWNGVTTGDFDGDGDQDLLATNWGLNIVQRASPAAPYRLYFGDFDGSGALQLLEASRALETGQEMPERDLDSLAAGWPAVRANFPTHAAFGRATVADVLGPALANARRLEANTLASMLFLNHGDHFTAVPLPRDAQWAPAFAAGVADMDGDGGEDVFLSQNFFATQPKLPRCDAGRGLWLRGDGRGGFEPVSGWDSGVAVYGEQRGAAAGDFDGDGRVDLVVTQNGNATRLFRNVGARPGLRVRLTGPPGNSTGVGAVLRRWSAGRPGPAREIHAGSGYWSSDSAVQVLAGDEGPSRVEVSWPGGRRTEIEVPANAREVEIRWPGELTVVR
jgi:hypothetical protein